MAEHVACLKEDFQPCGKNWLKKFKKRNLSVRPAIGRRIDTKRMYQAANGEEIQKFFAW